jgi:hypothetical protein
MEKNAQMVPYEEVQKLATAVARSGMFQAFKNPEQALVLMMMAQVEGCHPMQAVQRYDVIQGKPAKKSDAMLADFQQRGGKVTWTEYTDEAVEAEFASKGMDKPCRVRWTYKQAEAAGLTGKPTWKQFKRQMLKARVISEGVRISDPGVVAGLYTPEEVGDFDSKLPSPIVEAHMADAQQEQAQPAPQPEASAEDKVRDAKVRALVIAMSAAGIKAKDDVLAWLEIKTGRKVESRKDLTVEEIDRLMGELAGNGKEVAA